VVASEEEQGEGRMKDGNLSKCELSSCTDIALSSLRRWDDTSCSSAAVYYGITPIRMNAISRHPEEKPACVLLPAKIATLLPLSSSSRGRPFVKMP
jgi:hypothetical protein